MEFRILGPLEVWDGDRRLSLGGPKHRALLAILLLEANRVVSTDRLIQLLWRDEPPKTVGNTLQVCVSQLRKILEPGHVRGTPYQILVSQEPGYFIRLAPDQLDLHRFEQLREAARQASSDGRRDAAAAALRGAIALWRGPALTDLASEAYVLAEAKRLHEMRLQTVEDRIEADLALGQHADLVAELEALVGEFPLRERLRGQLMIALYRSGRQAEASEVFHKTRATLVEEVGMEPNADLQKLLKAILNQDPALDLAPDKTSHRGQNNSNLPLQLTSFVGRISEVADVKRRVSQARCVTLVGPGGVGKTRLAIQVAGELSQEFPEGEWLVELASLTDSSLIPQSVANSLGVREQAGVPIMETIIFYLERRKLLVVLDNCEHLVEPSAQLVDRILRTCPSVRVLATSREPLRVAGEMVWRAPSLSLPPEKGTASDQELSRSEAVQLFCERATSANASFSIDRQGLRVVAGICRRLDSIPLAIELAAAKVSVLSLEDIATRLDDRFGILKDGNRSALPRHQTLEAAIDWSFDLLTPEEQNLLSRLSVFAGSFSLEAAEFVGVNRLADSTSVLEKLSGLVDKSLVVALTSGSKSRYRLLETVRRYAQRRLALSGEDSLCMERHLDWCVSLSKQAEPLLRGPRQQEWLRRLDQETDNFRAALEWGSASQGGKVLQLANALVEFWARRGDFTEGRQWLKRAIDSAPTGNRTKAEALAGAAWMSGFLGDHSTALDQASESVNLYEKLDDRDGLGVALIVQGTAKFEAGHHSEGLAIGERSVAILRQGTNRWALGVALNNLGFFGHLSGDRSSLPRTRLEESFRIVRETRDEWTLAFVLDSLGEVALDHGRLEEAWSYLSECSNLALRLDDKRHGAHFLEVFAGLAVNLLKHGVALRLASAAVRLRSDAGIRAVPADQAQAEAIIKKAREALTAAEADAAWRQGEGMSMQDALHLAYNATSPAHGVGADYEAANTSLADAGTEARAQLPPATRTFMFTDMVKSSNLIELIGDDAWEDLLRWHDHTLRSLVKAHGGEEINRTGDGFFVAFLSAPAAVECAVAIQRALADHRRVHGFAPRIRIGLHTAKATRNGRDYTGRGVHIAARIGALAEGESILASVESLNDGSSVSMSGRRTVSLRGIADPIEIARIEWR